jgi:hypothetical protein
MKDEALDRLPWITRFGSGYGPVVRQRHVNDDDDDDGDGDDVTKTKHSANHSTVNVAKGKSVLIYRTNFTY